LFAQVVQPGFVVHATMQNADNLDRIFTPLAAEDHIPPCPMLAVAVADVAAS